MLTHSTLDDLVYEISEIHSDSLYVSVEHSKNLKDDTISLDWINNNYEWAQYCGKVGRRGCVQDIFQRKYLQPNLAMSGNWLQWNMHNCHKDITKRYKRRFKKILVHSFRFRTAILIHSRSDELFKLQNLNRRIGISCLEFLDKEFKFKCEFKYQSAENNSDNQQRLTETTNLISL